MLGQMQETRAVRRPVGSPSGRRLSSVALGRQVAHVLDRDDDLDLERLADAGVDDRDGPRLVRRGVPAEEPGHLLQRALRGRQPDALRRAGGDLLQALQRQRQVGARAWWRAMAWISSTMTVSTPDQRLRRRRREHQVEALRRRDEQVRRPADQLLALARRRVAGAHGDVRA